MTADAGSRAYDEDDEKRYLREVGFQTCGEMEIAEIVGDIDLSTLDEDHV